MTNCEQFRTKCSAKIAATLTLASTDVFLIKMWEESYNRRESWLFKNIFFVGKWVDTLWRQSPINNPTWRSHLLKARFGTKYRRNKWSMWPTAPYYLHLCYVPCCLNFYTSTDIIMSRIKRNCCNNITAKRVKHIATLSSSKHNDVPLLRYRTSCIGGVMRGTYHSCYHIQDGPTWETRRYLTRSLLSTLRMVFITSWLTMPDSAKKVIKLFNHSSLKPNTTMVLKSRIFVHVNSTPVYAY